MVLVGASIGGLAVRMLASEHPDRVAGLVLVDASSEDEDANVARVALFVPFLSSVGIFRLLGVRFGPPPVLDGLTELWGCSVRRTYYTAIAPMQRDLDRYRRFYKFERSHQGYRLRGRTPAEAFYAHD